MLNAEEITEQAADRYREIKGSGKNPFRRHKSKLKYQTISGFIVGKDK